MSWTPEREAEARRLWAEGQSAMNIARKLGGVTRVAVIGKLHRMGLGRDRVTAKSRPRCAVAGCGQELSDKNTSGVCMTHAHAAGLCRCPACRGEAVARRAEPQPRADVRVALIQSSGNGASGAGTHVRVSLPREPWAAP